MKNRFPFIIGIIMVLLFLAVVWLWNRPTSVLSAQQPKGTPNQPSPATQIPNSWKGNTYAPLPADRKPGYDPSLPQWAEWRRRRALDRNFEWKMPINFYGKVVDQDGQPVQNVKVRFQWTDMSATGTSEKFTETNRQGMFSLTNERGKNLGVYVSKDGYHALNQGRASFEYAAFFEPDYHEPDVNKPVIFHLLKKNPAEPIIQHGPTLFGIKPDGSPAVFDLATGRKNTGDGNVSIRITKGEKSANKQFNWEVTLEAVGIGAGLLESKEEFMTAAPESGYQPGWKFSQKAGEEKYQAEVKSKFFVKTAGGQFARIEVRVFPEYNDTAAVDLVSYLNPKPGDRNLEFDPAKVVKSP